MDVAGRATSGPLAPCARVDVARALAALAVVAAALPACGERARPPAEGATASAAEAPRFELHEWGLIGYDALAEDARFAAAVSGGARRARAAARADRIGDGFGSGGKPVLYVHTDARDLQVRVRVQIPGGEIVEHLPRAAHVDGTTVTWPPVRASRGACPTTERVGLDDPHCRGLPDGYCEGVENPEFDTADAACLQTPDGARHNHLFYRGAVPIAGLPLRFARASGGDGVEVAAQGAVPVSGKLLVVRLVPGHGDPHVVELVPPAPGAGPVTLPTDGPARSCDDARAALRDGLRERGLTGPEAEAFLRAWGASLFGGEDAPGGGGSDGTAAASAGAAHPSRALAPSPYAAYYFLPEAALAERLPLDVEPAPARLARAMLVKADLRGAEPGRGLLGAGVDFDSVRVRYSAPVVAGPRYSVDVARRIVTRHINAPRYCFVANGVTEGIVAVEVALGPGGLVERAAAAPAPEACSFPGCTEVARCIEAALRRWTFPAPERATDSAGTPVTLRWRYFAMPIEGR
jgi:hypothetical protein